MNNNLLKHPRFLLKNEIDMKLIYKSMIFRSNYSIRAINLNTSTFYLSRTDLVKIIFRVNGSFRYKSLTAHKAITYFDYIMHNNNIEKNNIPLIALCCYILSAKFCENDPTVPEEKPSENKPADTKPSPETGKPADTSDTTDLMLWGGITMLAAGAAVTAMAFRRREN